MPTTTWTPACPSCGRPERSLSSEAEGRREAEDELRGNQATCAACGTTFTVDHRTVVRRA